MLRIALVLSVLALPNAVDVRAQGHLQDVLGVSFAGNAAVFDSRNASGFTLGATTRAGHNGMARIGDDLYTTEQVGTGAAAQFFLNRIDDATGIASRSVALSRDLRALAPGGSFALLAIAENGASDQLVSVNVLSGAITVIGGTGFSSVQGLTLAGNTFYGWDLSAGLLRIDHLSGRATDVNPNVGAEGAGIQFLSTLSDGRVIGGQFSIYELDLARGVPSLQGAGAYSDLRGAEERFGVVFPFGTGCNGIAQTIGGSPRVGGSITTASSGHGSFDGVIVMIGFSASSFGGLPLPLNLGPTFGIPGCFLYAGPELTIALRANLQGNASTTLPIPAFAEGLVLRLQHVNFRAPGGGIGFSNGAGGRIDL